MAGIVPNHLSVVEGVLATGQYDLKTHAGQAAFVDAVVLALHAHDPRWGHLIKRPGQTNIHGHGEDSALYKLPNSKAHAVDFIEGAGGPNPKVGWGPDPIAHYKHSDWLDPADHDVVEEPPPASPSFLYPDEGSVVRRFQDRVRAAYRAVDRSFPDPFDEDAFRHFARYGFSCSKMPEPEAANKHIAELRSELGAPPEPQD